MRLSRPLATAVLAAALCTGLVAVPGTASASSTHHSAEHGTEHAGQARATHVKRFELKGTITDIDADAHTMTLQVRLKKHGKKRLVTVDLVIATDARVRLNGLPAAEGDLVIGDRAQVRGTVLRNSDGSRTLQVTRLSARGPRDTPDTSTT